MLHSIHRSRGAHRACLAAYLAIATATACRDLPAPADPVARPINAMASARSTTYEPDFDRYTASVVVTLTGGGIRQLPAVPERRVEYTVDRSLDDGEWTTTYDFTAVREAGTLRRVPIRKVVAGLDGMKYFDHNGDLIPLGSRIAALPNGSDFPAMPGPAARRGRGQGGNPRAWADNLVTSAGVAEQRRAQLEQSFRRAGTRGRMVKYRREQDGVVTEIVLDTTRGTIEETHTAGPGRFQASTRFEYQDIGNERWLRVRAVQRHEDTAGDRHPLTVEQVLIDQRFHRAEGR